MGAAASNGWRASSPSTIRAQALGNTEFPEKHRPFRYRREPYPDEFPSFFEFTFVRNPFERLHSSWTWGTRVVRDLPPMTLREFIASRPPSYAFAAKFRLDGLSIEESIDSFDHVARFKRLADEFRFLQARLGLAGDGTVHANRTEGAGTRRPTTRRRSSWCASGSSATSSCSGMGSGDELDFGRSGACMTPEDWETTARAEVRKAQGEFHARLAALRSKVESHGADSDAFLRSTSLFDGPPPPPLAKGALAESFRMCGSRDELLRSIRLPAGSTVCELGVWKGAFTRRILAHLAPATCHLFDLTFAPLDPAVRSHPAVVLHEGDSGAAIASLPDASVDFAYVDGDHSYQGARRDLFGVFPKVKPGGLIQVNDYTPWSVLSGFPYGVMAGVHELLNGGGCTLIGFGLHPFGHHDLLIRKS